MSIALAANNDLITESVYGNRFLFQGREYDYDTALYYFRARWYEPETGRWLSPDPIGISGGLNLYAFCGNDPVNYIDPTGNGGVQFGDYFLGWGDPWLVFDDSTLDTMWNGGAAAIDGMIPVWDPLRKYCDAYANECGERDSAYDYSYKMGEVAAWAAGVILPIKNVYIGVGLDILDLVDIFIGD